MLDDDFKKIEDFLKLGGNSELQMFQEFEKLVDGLFVDIVKKNEAEGFSILSSLVHESYSEYDKNSQNVVKDFAISIIILKRLILILKDDQDTNSIKTADKSMYITLMKTLMKELKKEVNIHLNFFKGFSEYVDNMDVLVNTED